MNPLQVVASQKQANLLDSRVFRVQALSERGTNKVEHVFDQDYTTIWESDNHYRYIEIDLEGTYALDGITIFNQVQGYYYYNIYASNDGEHYMKVAYKDDDTLAKAEGDYYALQGMHAKKLRIDVTFASSTNESNIAEIELFGSKINDEKGNEPTIEVLDFKETDWAKEYERVEQDVAYANQKTINEMSAMVKRVVGEEYVDAFTFELRAPTQTGFDVFEIESIDHQIVIRGNDGVSMASGLNHYLKNYANVYYNPLMGSTIAMPEVLPVVTEKIVKDTPYEERYALNFCTYSYTMSFWDFDEYEAFLDWAAMNGYNLILDIVGQEEVLRRTLNEFGYSDAEVMQFMTGPAYFAWFYMQNMTSFGGPLPHLWFEQRVELGRKMHDRMQTLGITPVLQGYSGMVPLDFTDKNPDAQILTQGGWCGYDRPNMLRTFVDRGRDYFAEVAAVFYEKQQDVFGNITNYYAVDPFHEGGNTGGLHEGKIYGTIQEAMLRSDEEAIWVIQHWQGNPSNSKINGLVNKEQVMILDLNSDLRTTDYKRFEQLEVPWVWNMLHNFGGRMGLDGQPEKIANNMVGAYQQSNYMKGIGITPEALNNSPMVYELMSDMIWERDPINFREWIYDYIEARYGTQHPAMQQAWDLLLETAYKDRSDYYQGAAESVINARPNTTIHAASTWGNNKIPYDKEVFESVIPLFIEAYETLKDSDAFIYDMLDVVKQVLANSAQEYHKELVKAYNAKDLASFNHVSQIFIDLIKLQERVLSTAPEFMVGTWIEQARTMIDGADDWTKDLFEFNARALISTWGDYKNGSLNDYSNRQWAGVTEDLYLKRWEMWIQNLRNELEGKPKQNINWHKVEWAWAVTKAATKTYPTQGSKENLADLANLAFQQFSVTNMEEILGSRVENANKNNIALGKPVTSSVESHPQFPTSQLTDGTNGTAWMANSVSWPASLTLDLQELMNVDGMAIALNQAAGGFSIQYLVEVYDGNKWEEIARYEKNENISGTIYLDYKGSASQVRVTLDSNDPLLTPELSEIYVFEGERQSITYTNVGLHKPTSSSSAQRPAANINDGDESSLWVAANESYPSWVDIDLQGAHYVDYVELVYEYANLGFKFKLEVIDEEGIAHTILDLTQNQEPLQKVYKVNVGKVITNVTFTITGKAQGIGDRPGAWPAAAELKVMSPNSNVMESENIAYNKPVVVSSTQSGKPGSHITDGNKDTLWIANGEVFPSFAKVELGKTYFVEDVTLTFEKAGLAFKFIVEGITSTGERIMLLDKSNNKQVLEKTYQIPVKEYVSEIEVTFVGKEIVGNAYLAWPAIAQIEVMSKPQNVAYQAKTNGYLTLVDENYDTSAHISKGQEVIIELPQEVDLFAMETYKLSEEALRYKVEYSLDGQRYKPLIDKLTNTNNLEYYLDEFTPVLAKYIKVMYMNEEVVLNEIKLYKADGAGMILPTLSKVEQVYQKAVVGSYAGEYPQSAKDDLLEAINQAKAKIDEGCTSLVAQRIVKELEEALHVFYRQMQVIDRVPLARTLNRVESFLRQAKHIVDEQFASLQIAYDTAYQVYEMKKVMQSQLDEQVLHLTTTLQDTLDLLEVDTAFMLVLMNAKELLLQSNEKDYPVDAIETFKAVIEELEAAYLQAADQGTLQNLRQQLQQAMDEFMERKIIIDETALIIALEEAKIYIALEERYTTTSFMHFKKVYEDIVAAYETTSYTQEELDEWVASLQCAIEQLEERKEEQPKPDHKPTNPGNHNGSQNGNTNGNANTGNGNHGNGNGNGNLGVGNQNGKGNKKIIVELK